MPRTDSDAVKLVLAPGLDYDTDNAPSLEPHIAKASAIVTRVAACAVDQGESYSAEELELMERWLAAHSYVMSDQTYASKSTLGRSASFHGQTGMHLDATKYGQEAKSLDFFGCLAALTSGKKAKVFWVGRPPSDQTPYVDRD